MTSTRTLVAATASSATTRDRVVRFNRTERVVHAVQAVTFLILLFTGLAISLTWLESLIGHRELLRQIHLATAFFFVFGPALVALAGDRLAIRKDIRDVEEWSKDDLRWLASPTVEPTTNSPASGRFNAGQKLNAIFTVYCTLAFGVTGLILWQNRRFPFSLVSEANTIHQWLAYIALIAFLGHIYLAVVHPATRAALGGIITGTVGADWARRHHPLWMPKISPESPLSWSNLTRSLVMLALGLEGAALLTRWGFEWLGANITDPVVKAIYRFSGLPGTAQHATTGVRLFDFGAIVWLGLIVALWYGTMRNYKLLPQVFPAPAQE